MSRTRCGQCKRFTREEDLMPCERCGKEVCDQCMIEVEDFEVDDQYEGVCIDCE